MTDKSNFVYKDLILDVLYLSEECSKLSQVITTSRNALYVIHEFPFFVDAIKQLAGKDAAKFNAFPNIIKTAELAKREIDNEFQFLNTQFALMLYAYLEAGIKRLIKSFFKINKHTEIKEISEIQIKLYEYMQLDEVDRYEYLYQQYEKKIAAGLLYGLSRFEKLLTPIGLSGEVSDSIQRNIFELSQVRNIIIHNGGIVDRHFVKNCPWLKPINGEKFVINKELTNQYFQSINEYSTILSYRIGIKEDHSF